MLINEVVYVLCWMGLFMCVFMFIRNQLVYRVRSELLDVAFRKAADSHSLDPYHILQSISYGRLLFCFWINLKKYKKQIIKKINAL